MRTGGEGGEAVEAVGPRVHARAEVHQLRELTGGGVRLQPIVNELRPHRRPHLVELRPLRKAEAGGVCAKGRGQALALLAGHRQGEWVLEQRVRAGSLQRAFEGDHHGGIVHKVVR